MIDLYTWRTPNGRKISILLEELGLSYTVHPIDLSKGEQVTPAFLAMNPNHKIPVIVDSDGDGHGSVTVFESGAVMIYLAEKTGSPLLPPSGPDRYAVLQWMMLQMSGIGPIFGQVHHFYQFAKQDVPYAKSRFGDEMARLYGVIDTQLSRTKYLALDAFSLADIALYPWIARQDWHPCDMDDYVHVKRWYDLVGQREAVRKGMTIPAP